jgi:hypothetical protein
VFEFELDEFRQRLFGFADALCVAAFHQAGVDFAPGLGISQGAASRP